MSDIHDCEPIARAVAKEEINLFRNGLISSFNDEINRLTKELKDLKKARNGFVGGFTKKLAKSNIFTQNEVKIHDIELKLDFIKSVKNKISDSSKYYS